MAWWRGLTVGVVAVALLVTGCSGDDEPAPTTTPPTPITSLDPAAVALARVGFCDQVRDAEVRRALGAEPTADDSWGNGDPLPGSGKGDVAHELGCSWTGPGGTAARAWVFARPVGADLARTLVTQAGRAKGCTAAAAPVFGKPALLQTCTPTGGPVRVRRAGLFSDTWVTCELSLAAGVPEPDRRARLDDWCAAVAGALRTG